MKKTFLSVAIAVAALTSGSALANSFNWGNIYGDYYKHDRESNKTDAKVFGVEGGMTTSKHDVYGFAEYDMTADTTFVKGSNHFKFTQDGKVSLYAQASNFSGDGGGETVALVGAGYTFSGDIWSFKPFIGAAKKTGSWAGTDSTMVGWAGHFVAGPILLTNWTEVEVDTKVPYTVNGAFGAWYDLNETWYTGVQYTYSYKTAGETRSEKVGNSIGLRFGAHF